tara:strand:- start:379 stop:2157 length:1779 start_codon:yes stop_codon:yes gene_type:complete
MSFSFFDEELTLRIINDASDAAYFPLINSFSDFNFSNSYSNNIEDLKLISYPVIGLLINSLFFKILGGYSFIFLELICIFLFLIIFYNIFLILNFSKLSSFTFSVFLFILPTIFKELTFVNIEPIKLLSLNFETFYSTRFPRPAISNLFFFSFIFFIIQFYVEEKKYLKYLFFIILLMGFTLNIFFYLFFIELFLLTLIFILKFKSNFFKIIINNYRYFLYYTLILILFLGIFQMQVFFSEPDYVKRLGVFKVDLEQKKNLFRYLINFFFGFKFLFLLLINVISFILLKNNTLRIFFYLFIASIISPIFFFLVLNKGVDYYHFFNWIVVAGFIYPVICVLFILDSICLKLLNINQNKILFSCSVFLMLFYFSISNISDLKANSINDHTKRTELREVIEYISQNNFDNTKNLEILSFNYEISIWLLLNDFKNFSIIPVSFWTPKTDVMLENELISSTKFLGLDKNNFYQLIKNQQGAWRFKNNFVYDYFGRKYMANSLVVFNNDQSDFNQSELDFIKSNNLLISHQIIIPKSEIKRLLYKFDNSNEDINPDLVILDTNDKLKTNKFENKEYCLIFNNNRFKIFSNKILDYKCL